MPEIYDTSKGEKLLAAVDRLVADTEDLVARGDAEARKAASLGLDGNAAIEKAASEVVAIYSNRSAVSGGTTALPAALLPGLGTALTLGGAVVDAPLLLKYELEMSLVLSHVYGFNIRATQERQIAFLLASVSTYSLKTKGQRNFFVDIGENQARAVWNYAPQEVSRFLLISMSEIAVKVVGQQLGKNLAKAIPFVGIAVGAVANKVMTQRVGRRCMEQLAVRRHEVRRHQTA